MQGWVIDIMNQYGYFGVALLCVIENIFLPLPSEIILVFGGFMTTHSDMNIWLVVLFAVIGSVVGAILLYCLGLLISMDRIKGSVDKWEHALHIKSRDLETAENWFNRYGSVTVLFCRFIPIVRCLISIPAGMVHMNFIQFIIYTVIGSAVWNTVLVKLGAFAGDNWETIVNDLDVYSEIALVVLGVILIAFLIWFVRKKKREAERDNNTIDK